MAKKVTHDDFVEKLFTINQNIEVVGKYKGARKPIEVKCKIDGFIWSPLACNLIHKNHPTGCPICNNGRHAILCGTNALWTTHPHIAIMLKDKNIGFEESHGSERRTNWICQRCGNEIKDRSIYQVKAFGLACPFCSDGTSYPEKFTISILNQLGIDYIPHKTFQWSNQKEYDFYILNRNDEECIIETHGELHYTNKFHGKTTIDQKENDNHKEQMAAMNNITQYFQIDCRKSEKEWIMNSFINSGFLTDDEILSIDWEECNRYASTHSCLIDACDMYNNGLSINKISANLKKSTVTIKNYLHKGTNINLCNYCTEAGGMNG